MNVFDGLKTIWSNPEVRNVALGYTAAAVAATGAVTYAATRVATKKWRKEKECYLAEPEITTVDGELYRKMPNGNLEPYSPNRTYRRNNNQNSNKRKNRIDTIPRIQTHADVIYIKGRPFRIDENGNYTPVKRIGY